MILKKWRRRRLDLRLGQHLVETRKLPNGDVWLYPGHARPQVHDGLPRHIHNQRTGAPFPVDKNGRVI